MAYRMSALSVVCSFAVSASALEISLANLSGTVYRVNMVNEKKIVLGTRVTPDLAALIRRLAAQRKWTPSFFIEETLRKALMGRNGGGKK